MKAVSEPGNIDAKLATISLTGDGRREQSLLKAFAERYNGEEFVLQLPATVAPLGHGNKLTGRFAGFSVLQTIKTYVSKWKFTRYLLLIDKEYFNDEDLISEIKNNLTGFNLVKINSLADQAFLINCNVGSHDLTIHAVVCGKKKCVEENIAKLINLEFGTPVKPTKSDIDRTLNQHDSNLYMLIKNAREKNLCQAFTDLTSAFSNIESILHNS
jgi:hypothetical protein